MLPPPTSLLAVPFHEILHSSNVKIVPNKDIRIEIKNSDALSSYYTVVRLAQSVS